MSDEQSKMPLLQHLEELRTRLLICCLAVGLGFVISYFFSNRIFEILMRPWINAMPLGSLRSSSTPHPMRLFSYI